MLLIHEDGPGASLSENNASNKALKGVPVNSASIMVPCHWLPEIVAYACRNYEMDLGVHLKFNAERSLKQKGSFWSSGGKYGIRLPVFNNLNPFYA